MSDDLGGYVRNTIAERHFDNVSEYFQHLVRSEMESRKSDAQLRELIDEGLASGVSELSLDEIWAGAAEDGANKSP
ncbi:Conserved protein of unknown function [Magnetospira sp. QH-2]|nr:Conserved protein of unknown function [Magnetospira sp. QH-2]